MHEIGAPPGVSALDVREQDPRATRRRFNSGGLRFDPRNVAQQYRVEAAVHRVRKDFGETHDCDVHRIPAAIRQSEDENPRV